ncbi:MAG: GAF domain-containing protein, partial [Acidobacteriia bacterium]|nr:GAF domain-containing protein [Terriglobia bacterium]
MRDDPVRTPLADNTAKTSNEKKNRAMEEREKKMPSIETANPPLDAKQILKILTAFKKGDFSVRLPLDWTGVAGKVADTFNSIVETNERVASELARLSQMAGKEGKPRQRLSIGDVTGAWAGKVDSINTLLDDLTRPATEMTRVISAVARGDLSQSMAVESEGQPLRGSFLQTANILNTMVSQLGAFASEVARVACEVGTEGKLGGQAEVTGMAGTWKDLTDNVNSMAANLTNQVRNIAGVTKAVAAGDLSKKISVDVRGEFLDLKETVNTMVEQLRSFASEVTRVAREVGVEGRLGGQASVPGAAGTWKDLTDNVNQLAANLSTQVRAIAEVSTAVTKGDLTRSIRVEASGEVAALKDNLNEMIDNLRDTTRKNNEQDWLKTNLAKFTRMLQGQRDLMTVSKMILSELAPLVSAAHGVLYLMEEGKDKEQGKLKMLAAYAYTERKNLSTEFRLGEGLVGQCALEKQRILLSNAPPDYIQVTSGLGQAAPLNIIVLPILFEGEVRAVIELASFERFSPTHQAFLDQLTESIGIVLNTLQANMRTEQLLNQSQSMARELQSQQEELQQTNEELEEKAQLLSDQKTEVERKNREVEQAKQSLEEKAGQLSLTSKYKSEFLSNMSHELRTPLNSLLMLAQQLAENAEGNLTPQQAKSADTITSAGGDLLNLINDILDLSKIESGTVTVDLEDLSFRDLQDGIERTFRHVAASKRLNFEITMDRGLPPSIATDPKRLQQVLKNLLSNAFKFTAKGKVELRVGLAGGGWSPDHEGLNRAGKVLAFAVQDTGIGIAQEKQKLIFEAFQQADGTTSRKYGGTGLGLTISREIARLLGGSIQVKSEP